MRSFLLALLAATAPLAVAQTRPDSASSLLAPPAALGVFVEGSASSGYGGSSLGVIGFARTSVGYRLANGVSVGGTAFAAAPGSDVASVAFGPDLRLSRPLDGRTTLDFRLSATAGFASLGDQTGLRATGVGSLAEASATRRFRVGGVTLAATGGAYGGLSQGFGLDADATFAGRDAATTVDAGLIVGLQAEFRGLGGRFAIGPVIPVSLVSTRRDGVFGTQTYRGALRTPGLITYQGKHFNVSVF